jgi:hypothetical protein
MYFNYLREELLLELLLDPLDPLLELLDAPELPELLLLGLLYELLLREPLLELLLGLL